MRRIFIILLILNNEIQAQSDNDLCKSINEIAAGEQNRVLRTLSTNGSNASSNFQVTYYRCFWEIDPAVRYIKGSVTSHFITNTATNNISYDLSSQLAVDSVYFHGSKISFSRPVDIVQINFPINIPQSQKDSVTIFYKGVPSSTSFGSFETSIHNSVPVLWTLSEPYGSKEWWPCRNGVDDKADSIDIIVSCPNGYRTSSNGQLINETDNGVTRIAHYRHRYPIASYLVAIAVTNYKILNHNVLLGAINLPVITYCYPESENSFASNTPNLLQMLSLFHQHFGQYPFVNERYGQTQFGWGGGMEHQTNSFVVSTNENLMAHELAHQWFGDKITCGSWQDIWLNEGFATYLSYFHFEKTSPGGHITRLRNLNNSITASPGGSVWVDDTTNIGRIFSSRLSYNKGAYLLHMLRWVLGDSSFFRGLRQYLSDPKLAYGFARTNDLKRNLEQNSGKDLTEFFNDWFTGQGHPTYTVKWTENKNNWARITISQVTSHSSVSYFEMPIALQFRNATQQKTVVVNNTMNNEIFWEEIGFVADTVIIDPEYWILSGSNVSIKEQSSSVLDNDLKVYPVPTSSDITISIKNPVEKKLDLRIFNSSGQLLSRHQFPTPGPDELFQINISKFAAGVYLLRFDAGDVRTIRRVIKK